MALKESVPMKVKAKESIHGLTAGSIYTLLENNGSGYLLKEIASPAGYKYFNASSFEIVKETEIKVKYISGSQYGLITNQIYTVKEVFPDGYYLKEVPVPAGFSKWGKNYFVVIEEIPMADDKKIANALTVVKADGTDAFWRTGAKQTVRAVHGPLSALLNKHLPIGVSGVIVDQLLNTDHGEAILAYALGNTMQYIPKFNSDPKLVRLAKEMRVLGLTFFTDKVADAILTPLRDQLMDIVNQLPFSNDQD